MKVQTTESEISELDITVDFDEEEVKEKYEDTYQYGGTWKSKKK